MSEMAPKRFLKDFLQLSGNKHRITLSKMTQNLKAKAYFMQNIMELDMKKFSNSKALTFEVWGLKTSLGKFGLKAFCKGLQALQPNNKKKHYKAYKHYNVTIIQN